MRNSNAATRPAPGTRNAKRSVATNASYLERVNLAIDHIRAHPHEPVRLRELARIACLSPFHFHRVFQALVGETPADFSLRLRLEKAVGAMAFDKRQTLTSIAVACGFGSSSDFSRAFKRRYGVSPRAFDVDAWRASHGEDLRFSADGLAGSERVAKLPTADNSDAFRVRVRELPARTVAYIRVEKPYQGDRVIRAISRLMTWAERHGVADRQWLGYQWENPEITELAACHYFAAVELPETRSLRGSLPRGEIGRYQFPPMLVAQVDMNGGIDLELRALQWLYGVWLPKSRYVPADQPSFEAWVGRPFAHGSERFELGIQLPIKAYR